MMTSAFFRGLHAPATFKLYPITLVSMGLAVALAASSRVGRADAPTGRYTLTSGVVMDTQTGLSWTQAASSMEMNESDAVTYCAALKLGGNTWRVPSVAELQSIIDETRYDPALDPVAFPNAPSTDLYWSQSLYNNIPGFGWGVEGDYGLTTVFNQLQNGWVLCVSP
jgi:hypothetical protein